MVLDGANEYETKCCSVLKIPVCNKQMFYMKGIKTRSCVEIEDQEFILIP